MQGADDMAEGSDRRGGISSIDMFETTPSLIARGRDIAGRDIAAYRTPKTRTRSEGKQQYQIQEKQADDGSGDTAELVQNLAAGLARQKNHKTSAPLIVDLMNQGDTSESDESDSSDDDDEEEDEEK